jgi:oligoendopeptidase F
MNKRAKIKLILTSVLALIVSGVFINNSEAALGQYGLGGYNDIDQIMMEMQSEKNKEKYTIDIANMFKDENEIYTDLRIIKQKYEDIKNYKGKLFDDRGTLLKVLNDREAILRFFDKAEVYATIRNDLNFNDEFSEDMLSIISTYRSDAEAALSYILPEIDDASDDDISSCLNNKEYDKYKELIGSFYGGEDYYESEEKEKILALAKSVSRVSEDVFTTFTNKMDYNYSDVYFEGFTTMEKDLEKREKTLSQYYEKEKNGLELLATALEGQVKYDNFYASLSGYDSALEMAVSEDGITLDEYELIFRTNDENLHLLHRWNNLKKRILEVDEITLYDTFLPLSKESVRVDYNDAIKKVGEALSVLGEDYINEYNSLINGRRIDVFPRSNKYKGNYTWGSYDAESYVVMNYNNDLDSMLTLAHEVGHAINIMEMNKRQKYDYSFGSVFTGEITSTCNEILTLENLIKNAVNEEEKKKYLIHYIKLIEDTLYKQLLIAEFENKIHSDETIGINLDGNYLNELYSKIVKKYYGENYRITEFDGYEWTGIRHLYWNSYVYKYATGIATSINVSEKILSNQPGYLKSYQEFLGIGNDMSPIAAVRTLGVDFNDKASMEQAYNKFSELLDELEIILEK